MTSFGDKRLPKRFWDKIVTEPNSGCWLWIGATTSRGYGHIRFGYKLQRVHRIIACIRDNIYLPYDKKWVVDHRCNTTVCCNPDHLNITTVSQNTFLGCKREKFCRKCSKLINREGILCKGCFQTPKQKSDRYYRKNKHKIRKKAREYQRKKRCNETTI